MTTENPRSHRDRLSRLEVDLEVRITGLHFADEGNEQLDIVSWRSDEVAAPEIEPLHRQQLVGDPCQMWWMPTLGPWCSEVWHLDVVFYCLVGEFLWRSLSLKQD